MHENEWGEIMKKVGIYVYSVIQNVNMPSIYFFIFQNMQLSKQDDGNGILYG